MVPAGQARGPVWTETGQNLWSPPNLSFHTESQGPLTRGCVDTRLTTGTWGFKAVLLLTPGWWWFDWLVIGGELAMC